MQDNYWQMQPNPAKALMLAKRQLSEFVYDAVNLEGINMTLPEVQTLLEGITVGGHKLSDQQITVNQGKAWRLLFRWLERGEFAVSAQKACELHAVAAKEEALAWGEFRSGAVLIAGTDYLPPPVAELPTRFDAMVQDLTNLSDIYDQAIHIFLTMARCQFFYDVNKRMGRLMMNGHLLQQGYPAINLPAKRQLEFNQLMLAFYESGDEVAMNAFMRSCLDPRVLRIMQESADRL
ncbi:Fic family protein [Thiothrix eikelboomii]|uniref:Fic family protein n=1 Tax=Thiothrix eikelboomii TaxID=92487 RepID=UPI003BAFCC91